MTPLLLALSHRFLLPALPLGLGVLLLFWGIVATEYDTKRPLPDNVSYAIYDGQAYWVSKDARLNAWSARIFGDAQLAKAPAFADEDEPFRFVTAAPRASLAPPDIDILSDEIRGKKRKVVVSIRTARGSPELRLRSHEAAISAVSIDSDTIALPSQKTTTLDLFGISDRSVIATLEAKAGRSFALRATERSYDLPSLPLPARPIGTIAGTEGSTTDSSITTKF
jgi:hypothetical protein